MMVQNTSNGLIHTVARRIGRNVITNCGLYLKGSARENAFSVIRGGRSVTYYIPVEARKAGCQKCTAGREGIRA